MTGQKHPKAVRRAILTLLYEHYKANPLDMLSPEDVMEQAGLTREELVGSIHYLYERGWVELMLGYRPPLFVAARLSPEGVDLVENEAAFDQRFPPTLNGEEAALGAGIALCERLVQEADLCPLDGEMRQALQRDIAYLRDELARPAARWRGPVIRALLDWIGEMPVDEAEYLPSLGALRAWIEEKVAS